MSSKLGDAFSFCGQAVAFLLKVEEQFFCRDPLFGERSGPT
jgi:hypothetical protein